MSVRVNPVAAVLAALAAGGAVFAGGQMYVDRMAKGYAAAEAAMPETAMEDAVRLLSEKNYDSIYEATAALYPGYDTKETYTAVLAKVFAGTEGKPLHYVLTGGDDSRRYYRIYAGDEPAADVELYSDGGVWRPAVALSGEKSYMLEVPHGAKVSVGGIELGPDRLVKENVYWPVLEEKKAAADSSLTCDIYYVEGLLGEPAVTIAGVAETEVLKDAITGDLAAGEAVTDPAIRQRIIDCAELIAKYPAQEASAGAVGAVSVTNSYWYQRYVTLQNYWFTSHAKSSFTNQEVLNCIRLADDLIESQVIFDYYADNGEVNRTWYIGYQMTMRNVGGEWKVAGISINNELNPRTVDPEFPEGKD